MRQANSARASGEGELASGLRLHLKRALITINFMPPDMVEEHLTGMAAYAEAEVRDPERLPYVLSRIHQIRFVMGCVITPGIDEEGAAEY